MEYNIKFEQGNYLLNTPLTYNWAFKEYEEAVFAMEVARFVHICNTGIDKNEFRYIFKIILRILKYKSKWSE